VNFTVLNVFYQVSRYVLHTAMKLLMSFSRMFDLFVPLVLHFGVLCSLIWMKYTMFVTPLMYRELSRDELLACCQQSHLCVLTQNTRDTISVLGLRRRGCRGGAHRQQHLRAVQAVTSSVRPAVHAGGIPTIVGNRRSGTNVNINSRTCSPRNRRAVTDQRRPPRCLLRVSIQHSVNKDDNVVNNEMDQSTSQTAEFIPSLYVLNAAALSKPGAIEHLAVDLKSYCVDIAVVTETHFKSKHVDSVISIDGFTVHRRDRVGRRGGGTAIYVQSEMRSTCWTPTPTVADNRNLEIQWVQVGSRVFIAALYHPPRPTYKPEELLGYIESCVSQISHDFPLADIVLAGDLNQLSDQDVIERTGLTQIIYQPTRGNNVLDRVFVSTPSLYTVVRVVTPVLRSDHKAVVAFPDRSHNAPPKSSIERRFRRHTPAQHAQFLKYAVTIDFSNPQPTASSDPAINAQAEFDYFYATALRLLDQFYPESVISQTTRDPAYITPTIKTMLRRKNRLMRAGRVEEAGALAQRIGTAIQLRCKSRLDKLDGKTDAKNSPTVDRPPAERCQRGWNNRRDAEQPLRGRFYGHQLHCIDP